MKNSRGFTLVEALLVISLAAVIIIFSTRTFGAITSRYAAEQGRLVFESLHARARAQAIESGTMTRLVVDTGADSVTVVRNGIQLETVHFSGEMGIDIQVNSLELCMGPRGFALTDCNSFSSIEMLSFVQGSYSDALEILPLGQLVK